MQVDLCEFEVSLACIVSSRLAGATWGELCLKKIIKWGSMELVLQTCFYNIVIYFHSIWPVFICNPKLDCTQRKEFFWAGHAGFSSSAGEGADPSCPSFSYCPVPHTPLAWGTAAPLPCSGTLPFFPIWPTFAMQPRNSGGSRHPACLHPTFRRYHQPMKASPLELDGVSYCFSSE